MSIRIFYDDTSFRLKKWRAVREITEKVILDNNKILGDLNFIITGNNTILELNKQFLKKDYFTDVIAFNYNNEKLINGEIYISIDTVKKNAKIYKVSFRIELIRVMIHGVLHLCGFNDSNNHERSSMKKLEEYYLKLSENADEV